MAKITHHLANAGGNNASSNSAEFDQFIEHDFDTHDCATCAPTDVVGPQFDDGFPIILTVKSLCEHLKHLPERKASSTGSWHCTVLTKQEFSSLFFICLLLCTFI